MFGVSGNSFNSFFSGASSNSFSPFSQLTSSLTDYNMIRSGSYKKLMTSYFSKIEGNNNQSTSATKEHKGYSIADDRSRLTSSISVSEDTAPVLSNTKKAASDLQDSAASLLDTGSDSLFKETSKTDKDGNKTTGYDTDKIYKAVKSFVDDYNDTVKATKKATSSSIGNAARSMTNSTYMYRSSLEKVGITIGSDKQLTIDEDKFKAADMDKVKSLFNKSGSFAYNVKSQAAVIEYQAGAESAKANTYTNSGYYGNAYNQGSIWDSYF